MTRAFYAILSMLALVALTLPASALTKEEQRAARRTAVTGFLAEAIAIDSVCDALQIHMEYLWVELQRAKIDLDEILPEAGAQSASFMPDFATAGAPAVCRRGVEYYGPQGSKFPNMLTLQQ